MSENAGGVGADLDTPEVDQLTSLLYSYLIYGQSMRPQSDVSDRTDTGSQSDSLQKKGLDSDEEEKPETVPEHPYVTLQETTSKRKAEDELACMPMWKSYLYHLQQQAPKPKRIVCQRDISNKPPYYGREYHGAISRKDADFLLTIGGEGSYLIRESQRAPGQFTLAIRFDGTTKNFKLYYDGQHYVGEKRFDTVQDLVADGLITFYLELKAADYIAALSSQSNYAESPYVAYNTHKKRQLQVAPRRADRSDQQKRTDPQKRASSGSPGSAPASGSASRNNRVNLPVEGRLSMILENRKSKDAQQTQHAPQHTQSPAQSQHPASQHPASPHPASPHPASQHPASPHPVSQHTVSQHSAPQHPAPPHPPAPQHQTSQAMQYSPQPTPHQNSHQSSTTSYHTHPQPAVTSDSLVPDSRVSHSTNTDGPRRKSSSRKAPRSSVRTSSSATSLTSSSSTEDKKSHNFKMFEEPQFSTPPSSPPPSQLVADYDKQHNFKVSSVSWCTDYLEVMGCEKPHNFKLITFKGPHWCDYCANFLWGLIAQGVKCQDCGFNAHKKCSEKVPNDCMPDMKYVKRIFGIDLTTLVKAQNTLIPVVVEQCIQEIEKRGVDSEGMYRVAGFHDDVESIKMSFDRDGEMTDITEEKYDDINTISSLLKLYFRLLPIPLITFEVYFKVIDIVRREDLSHDTKLEMLKHTLASLPPAHYHTVKYLMAHLHRVTDHQQKNMMNPENLAIVFAPTLLRSPESDPLSNLSAVKYEREFIEIVIAHQNLLFD